MILGEAQRNAMGQGLEVVLTPSRSDILGYRNDSGDEWHPGGKRCWLPVEWSSLAGAGSKLHKVA